MAATSPPERPPFVFCVEGGVCGDAVGDVATSPSFWTHELNCVESIPTQLHTLGSVPDWKPAQMADKTTGDSAAPRSITSLTNSVGVKRTPWSRARLSSPSRMLFSSSEGPVGVDARYLHGHLRAIVVLEEEVIAVRDEVLDVVPPFEADAVAIRHLLVATIEIPDAFLDQRGLHHVCAAEAPVQLEVGIRRAVAALVGALIIARACRAAVDAADRLPVQDEKIRGEERVFVQRRLHGLPAQHEVLRVHILRTGPEFPLDAIVGRWQAPAQRCHRWRPRLNVRRNGFAVLLLDQH
eukprot:scaffold407_cov251-Pinguiococcus_pyrenoidosus.AAC.35